MELLQYRDWAVKQVLALRKISLKVFGKNLAYETKRDGSPVTVVDRKWEKLFRQAAAKKWPKHAVLGEEFGENSSDSPWTWIVDPIDGTKPYSRGLPSWGSLLALAFEGEPVVAVADYPALDTTLWAVKGRGAWEGLPGKAAKRLKVSKVEDFKGAVVFHSGLNAFRGKEWEPPVAGVLNECYLERGYGDCFAYWYMLRGGADLVLDFGVKVWDLAPFLLMTEEAGGKLVDFQGRRKWEGPQAVAGNAELVDQFVARLKTPIRIPAKNGH